MMGRAMNKSTRSLASFFTLEISLYLLAIGIALLLRLLNLGQSPLTDGEATLALQALQVARADTAAFIPGPYPAYIFLTGATFSIIGAGEFLARLWPVLAGTLLVCVPFFFRHELGRKTALVLAFWLAIDPGLVTVSRQVNGPMMALGFGLLALGLWHARHPAWAGIFAGLALLSGPAFWQGALMLGLAWLINSLLPRSAAHPGEVFDEAHEQVAYPARIQSLSGLAALITTVLVAGTYLLRYPEGLTTVVGSLTAYLSGWTIRSGLSPLTLIIALLVFQPLGMIFALVSLGRWLVRRLQYQVEGQYPLLLPLLWLLTSLILTLIYPSRQVNDLVWVLVPLLVIAAEGLSEYLPEEKPHVISWLQAGLVFVLTVLLWNTLIATSQLALRSNLPTPAIQLGILLGILLLAVLTTALVALGWSWQTSRDGLVWGLVAAFAVYSTSILWGSAQIRPGQPQELWGIPPGTGQVQLALGTLNDLSNWHTGLRDEIDIVSTVDTPSIRWALRNYRSARFTNELAPGDMPSVIITPSSAETPALTAAYRGQDFVWWVRPAWEGPVPDDFINWFTFRKAAVGYDYIILWARSDLFPGGSAGEDLVMPQSKP
jgi:hypothetical protein